MKSMHPETVTALLAQHPPARLIDVRLPSAFAHLHADGAVSACVFEVGFLAEIELLAPGRDIPLIVYDAGAADRAAEVAAAKLRRAGHDVAGILEGGLPAWIAAGFATSGDGSLEPSPSAADGSHPLDVTESRIEWTGRNLLNRHRGAVAIRSGHLVFERGQLISGEVVADLRAISCADLADPKLNRGLIAHLENDDFFDTGRFPEARFLILGAEPIPGRMQGSPNLRVHGELTLKDVTAPLMFEAAAGWTGDGRPAAQALVPIDRTLWNVIYGSGRLFSGLGGHLVSDLIELELRMVAGRNAAL